MGGPIGKALAKDIAKKLSAVDETQKSDCHDIMVVYFRGRLVASFGIRRSSNKDIAHPHIPKDLGVNEFFAKELGQCTKSRLQWLKKRGLIHDTARTEDDEPEE